jgi:hypothetical protein
MIMDYDNYHLNAVRNALRNVELSGVPAEISSIYIKHLNYGLIEFNNLVSLYGLTSKWDKTTGHYIVEKPGKAYQ